MQRMQHLARRKYSLSRISNGTELENETELEPETPSAASVAAITTLPTLPETSPYNRVDQHQEDDMLPSSKDPSIYVTGKTFKRHVGLGVSH